MLQARKYYNWMIECTKIINENDIKQNNIKKKNSSSGSSLLFRRKKETTIQKKSFWVTPSSKNIIKQIIFVIN